MTVRRSAAIVIATLVSASGCHGSTSTAQVYLPAAKAIDVAPASAGIGVAPSAPAITIYAFSGPPLGEIPEGGLAFDAAGAIVGTTSRGGTSNACDSGCGTIFRLSHGSSEGWSENVLHSFTLSDGAYPGTDLALDVSGNLYGTTSVSNPLGEVYGLIHRGGGWHLTVLHRFHGGRDGAEPTAGLIVGKRGTLFGVTPSGGTGGSGGNGTVFDVIPSGSNHWTENVIHRFADVRHGANPAADLFRGRNGTLYGTTQYGGKSLCAAGCGTVFAMTRSVGGIYTSTVIHAFDGSDGALPIGPLTSDTAGNLYGTAQQGGNAGCFAGCGVVFELQRLSNERWKYRMLHVFNAHDGGGPNGKLVVEAAGSVDGTTVIGGNVKACPQQGGCGVVYRLTPNGNRATWRFTLLHIFDNGNDGAIPNGGVVMGPDGNLYGTTISGGAASLGTVFEVAP